MQCISATLRHAKDVVDLSSARNPVLPAALLAQVVVSLQCLRALPPPCTAIGMGEALRGRLPRGHVAGECTAGAVGRVASAYAGLQVPVSAVGGMRGLRCQPILACHACAHVGRGVL